MSLMFVGRSRYDADRSARNRNTESKSARLTSPSASQRSSARAAGPDPADPTAKVRANVLNALGQVKSCQIIRDFQLKSHRL